MRPVDTAAGSLRPEPISDPDRAERAALADGVAAIHRARRGDPLDPAWLERVAAAAAAWHHGQRRRSGEPYIAHPLAVAELVSSWGMQECAVLAAMLHDVVEDTPATTGEVAALLEEDPALATEVVTLVEGLTKIDGLKLAAADARQAASLAKLLLAMAQDVRVLAVKLADRLHNIRTIAALPADKAARIAAETMQVYAPLAKRLGLEGVAGELQDRCFAVLQPARHAALDTAVQARIGATGVELAGVVARLRVELETTGIAAEVHSRRKSLWSLQEKMDLKGAELTDITDLLGVRVIVADDAACYVAVGVVHRLWTPLPKRFKDWIATPRYSTYQALHTTLIGPGGLLLEVQIRSIEMHRRAEWGVAAHWRYKQSGRTDQAAPIGWLERLADLSPAEAERSPEDFLEQLRAELAGDEVLSFTPRGEVVPLPAGATPIDFAYAIHSQVGHGCHGAKVNGRMVPLTAKLQTGDRVEIITGRHGGPNRQWLDVVVSAKARQHIRAYLARERRAAEPEAAASAAPAVVAPPPRRKLSRRHRRGDQAEVLVDGDASVATELASCCRPVYGDRLAGRLSRRRRAVVVHRADCPDAPVVSDLPVGWAERPGHVVVTIELDAADRPGLLADTTRTIADSGADILSSSTAAVEGRSRQRFELAIDELVVLDVVCARLRAKVRGVASVRRI